MSKPRRNWRDIRDDFLAYTRAERNGVYVLIALIILVNGYKYYDKQVKFEEYDYTDKLAEIEDGYMFTVVDMLLPKSLKSLSESRGFVIADYQSVLEDEWVKELAAKYTITRNEEVFDSIIQ